MRILIIVSTFFCLISLSCKNKKDVKTFDISGTLSGYWIPNEIKWGENHEGVVDTTGIFNIASFFALTFDSSNKFIFFSSVQRRTMEANDSLIFAGEPIVKSI